MTHLSDQLTLSAVPLVGDTSRVYPVSKMYSYSPFGQSGNHRDVD